MHDFKVGRSSEMWTTLIATQYWEVLCGQQDTYHIMVVLSNPWLLFTCPGTSVSDFHDCCAALMLF